VALHALTTILGSLRGSVTLSPAHAVTPPGTHSPTLDSVCHDNPSIACRTVWDITHNPHLAQVSQAYLAGPVRVGAQIAFVLVLALIARAAARRLINRVSARAAQRTESGGRSHSLLGERRQQRATALGSVLGNAASMTIFTIAAFIILGDLGLNLAPILASAGVLGIAIGFGAQNLVQDFLAGIFMLMEDQYGVGDVINIDKVSGTVEAVSLRITRIRDVNGVIWHIRNGTISQSGNESHGWARAVVDFPVPYDREIVEVRGLMESTAVAMWQDPAWQNVILERPEVWGVQEVTNESVLMRVIARTAPLRQWEVGRELRERVVSAIDLALLDLQVDPQPGRTAAQLAAVGEETRRPKSPRTTMRSRTGHAGGDDPISDEIEPKVADPGAANGSPGGSHGRGQDEAP
jgi:moderate conductance mechanosensitive channel